MDIVNQFGGFRDVIILLLIILVCFLVCALIRKRLIRFIVAIFATSFIVLQLISLYVMQSFVGYQFFVHFNLQGIQGMEGFFTTQIIILLLVFVAFIFLFFSANHILYKRITNLLKIRNRRLLDFSVAFLVIIFSVIILKKGSFLTDSKTLLSLVYTDRGDFKEILIKNGIKDYVTPENIVSSPGKNIIVISIESLEKAFLNDRFKTLTPNINQLKEDWNYYEMEQNDGSGWTSGSLYTYLTGFPAYFGVHGNSIFQNSYHSEITSISHVLKKSNYHTTYLNGNAEHAGIKNMLFSLEFDEIIDFNTTSLSDSLTFSKYGIRDKDLFEIAKGKLKSLKKEDSPYALFISTTDTHFPDGIVDDRMKKYINSKETDIEFTIASLDHMLGEFIEFLNEGAFLENTAVYIFPDHLKMGDPSFFQIQEDRGLFLITNADKQKVQFKKNDKNYQIDLPKAILGGSEIIHNVKFLSDYIDGDKNHYIKKHVAEITEINTNGLLRLNKAPLQLGEVSKNYLKYKGDTLRYIAHAGGEIDGLKYTNSKEALDLSYKKGFRLFELDIIETKDHKYVAAHDWEHWAKITDYSGSLPVTLDEFLKYNLHKKYTPLDMEGINEWFKKHDDAILVTDKVNDPIQFSKIFEDKDRLMMELFDLTTVLQGIDASILSAMPSQRVIQKLSYNEIADLHDKGVKNIAISRRYIAENKELLLKLKKIGIKPYVYHVNFDIGFDEQYVTKYEMDYIFGMYADKWEFE